LKRQKSKGSPQRTNLRLRCASCGDIFVVERKRSHVGNISAFWNVLCCSLPCLLQLIQQPASNDISGLLIDRPSWFRRDGRNMRSEYERALAWLFTVENIEFEYERRAIRMDDGSVYIPDFWFPQFGKLLEAKGWWGIGAVSKLTQIVQQLGDGNLILAPAYLGKAAVSKMFGRKSRAIR